MREPTPTLFTRFCSLLQKDKVRAVILMSGGGSNATNILKNRHLYPNIEFAAVVTDRANSNAKKIAESYTVPFICLEGSVKGKKKRTAYFEKLTLLLETSNSEVIFYAGFMKITPGFFLQKFPGINSHPADLRVLDTNGHRKYVGMDVIEMTLADQNTEIRCSCCMVEPGADQGFLIACSNPVNISPDDHFSPKTLHERMKKEAEWKYYPQVIKMISEGTLSDDSTLPHIFNTEDFS